MNMNSEMDRAFSLERTRQYICEGLEEDFESQMTQLKRSHERELALLSDTLYSEQRRQRSKMKAKLEARKKRRKEEVSEREARRGEARRERASFEQTESAKTQLTTLTLKNAPNLASLDADAERQLLRW